MIRHRPTGIIFKDRNEAIKILGYKRYQDMKIKNELEYLRLNKDLNNNN